MTTSSDPEQIRREIERTQAALSQDVDALTEGTMRQQRLLAAAPCEVDDDAVRGIFLRSLENW